MSQNYTATLPIIYNELITKRKLGNAEARREKDGFYKLTNGELELFRKRRQAPRVQIGGYYSKTRRRTFGTWKRTERKSRAIARRLGYVLAPRRREQKARSRLRGGLNLGTDGL